MVCKKEKKKKEKKKRKREKKMTFGRRWLGLP